MSLTGERDDLPGSGPQKAGVVISGLIIGMYATVAMLAALAYRDRIGESQYIDMALLDVQAAMLVNMNTNYFVSGEVPRRWDNARPSTVPYQTFQAINDQIVVAVGSDGQFRCSVDAGGMLGLVNDPCFVTNPQHVANRDVLVPILAEMVKRSGKNERIDKLEAADVPCSPINSPDEVFDNEQVQARGLRVNLPHPSAGTVKFVGSLVKMSATSPKAASHPPLLGEYTRVVLRDVLNLSADQVDSLRRRGVI